MSHAFRDTFKQIFCTCSNHRFIARLRLTKHEQRHFNQSLSYQTNSKNRYSENHQIFTKPIQQTLNDNQNRNKKQTTSYNLQFFNHNNSISL